MKRLSCSLLLLFVLTTSACNTVKNSSEPMQRVLIKSLTNMARVKSFHIEGKVLMTLHAVVRNTPVSQPITMIISGDIVKPDKYSYEVLISAGISGKNILQSVIAIGKTVYVKDSNVWQIVPENTSVGVLNPLVNPSLVEFHLPEQKETTYMVDHGLETLDNRELRHISEPLDSNAVNLVFGGSKKNANFIHTETLDMWMDESTNYLDRVEEKYDMSIPSPTEDTNNSKSTIIIKSISFDIIENLSKFNENITIDAPNRAVPLKNTPTTNT